MTAAHCGPFAAVAPARPTTLPASGASDVLYVLDHSSFLYRYVFASRGDGGASAVAALIRAIVDDKAPAYLAVAVDSPGATWRHQLFAAYKSRRERDPAMQAAIDRERAASVAGLGRAGVAVLESAGFEADDVIATLVGRATRAGLRTVILTHDKDMLQLVTPGSVTAWDGNGKPTGPEEVRARFGVAASQFIDYLALVGDASDGIPGVQGVGPKGAVRLLAEHGSLDGAIAALDGEGRARTRPERLLCEQREAALLARTLVTLRGDVPIEAGIGDLRVGAW